MPFSYLQTSHKLAKQGTFLAGTAIEKDCCSDFCTVTLEQLLCKGNEIPQLLGDRYQPGTTFTKAPLQPGDRRVF